MNFYQQLGARSRRTYQYDGMRQRAAPSWPFLGRQWLRAAACACLMALSVPAAFSHGDWPPIHGGVMNEGGETSFELVREQRGIVVYVSDHGIPLNVDGGLPELEIQRADDLQVIKGKAEGVSIVFPAVQIEPGDGITLRLKFASGRIIIGKFPLQASAIEGSGNKKNR